MDYLNSALPYSYRKGVISRKVLWEISPKHRENYCEDLTDDEIRKFVARCKIEGEKEHLRPAGRIKEMTAQKYYEACATCYRAIKQEEIDGKTPKEMYVRWADERDGGLSTIEDDSPEEFDKWYNLSDMKKWEIHNPSHLWEICQGSTHTRLHLRMSHDENGYYLSLTGGEHCRADEIVRMFNALCDAGYPVCYYPHQLVAKALMRDDEVGIVPCFDTAYLYWYGGFDEEKVLSFIRLSDEWFDEEQVSQIEKNAKWFDLPITALAE